MNINYVITLCCLCAGLLFDPVGILRMVLLASCIHELGHIAAYYICTHSIPPIAVSIGGFSLGSTCKLSTKNELIVLICGPLANIFTALFFAALAYIKAAYLLYFFMGANLCIGIYNLLPFGVLDGARIILCLVPPCKVHKLYTVQNILLILFVIVCICVLLFTMPTGNALIALILAPIYLILCEYNR
ncbi:MAG: hypothetical protein RR573_02585 [Oscillospiraceae bacterium]